MQSLLGGSKPAMVACELPTYLLYNQPAHGRENFREKLTPAPVVPPLCSL